MLLLCLHDAGQPAGYRAVLPLQGSSRLIWHSVGVLPPVGQVGHAMALEHATDVRQFCMLQVLVSSLLICR